MVNYHIPQGFELQMQVVYAWEPIWAKEPPSCRLVFVNFNAGTLGNAMIEGRVSAGVIVGEDSDVGGGASIMRLSGGNEHVISVGKILLCKFRHRDFIGRWLYCGGGCLYNRW